jgi:hypothetical protein
MADAQQRTSCRSVFKQFEILPSPHQYILTLMNFIINNQKMFEQIHLYTTLVQRISIIFTDQMPNYFVFGTIHLCWHQNSKQSQENT